MSDDIETFVKKMMHLALERQENVPEPNACSRFFAAVHYILSECFGCTFLDNTVEEDRGWPCTRLFNEEEAIYAFLGKEMRATILMDSSFYYLYVYFPPTETSYFVLDICQAILPLFESAEEVTIQDGITFIHTLKSRIGIEILNKIGNSFTPRMNESSMELINFSIPKEPKIWKERKTASQTTKFAAVDTKPSKLYSEIRKVVPSNCNIDSKLMGSILFIARKSSMCTLDSEKHEWPVMLDYSAEIIELVYQGQKYFFSLLNYKSDFYLIVRNEFSNLIAAQQIPKVVCPTFQDLDIKVDDVRISSIAVWLNALFMLVIDKDMKRIGSSARSSTSSLN